MFDENAECFFPANQCNQYFSATWLRLSQSLPNIKFDVNRLLQNVKFTSNLKITSKDCCKMQTFRQNVSNFRNNVNKLLENEKITSIFHPKSTTFRQPNTYLQEKNTLPLNYFDGRRSLIIRQIFNTDRKSVV